MEKSNQPSNSGNNAGGGRRNRGRGKRGNNKRGNHTRGNAGNRKNLVPPSPQIKLAFRQIGNPAVFGSTKAILEQLIQPLLEAGNEKTSSILTGVSATHTSFFMEMDVASKRHLIDCEEAAQKYLKEEMEKNQASESTASPQENTKVEEETPESNETANVSSDQASEEQTASPADPEVVVAQKIRPDNVPLITVRPLYVVPPKKTRRRGDKSGVAYILLTGPKIEKIEVPTPVPEAAVLEPTVTVDNVSSNEQASTEPKGDSIPATLDNDSVSKEVQSSQAPVDETTAPELVAENVEAATHAELPATAASTEGNTEAVAPPNTESSSTMPIQKPTMVPQPPAADYSRVIARGRLLLQQAIKVLQDIAEEDAKAKQNFAQVQIEPALSGKTWKWQNVRQDRREGTIETTPDYKTWLEKVQKHEEDLKSRPKPTPGGGAALSSDDPNNNGQPIAAIVQHLRAKKQEQKRKKSKKKGGKDAQKDKGKGSKAKGGGEGAKGKKKPKKRQKKKVGGGSTMNAQTVAPTALLKPSVGGTPGV